METSGTINELATALAKAQADMGHALKDSTNPHFKSRYADLQSVREAAKPLATHGIAIVQSCRMTQENGQMVAAVETRLIHTSGQWISDTLAVPVSKPDAQGIGSALTYGRRYTLAAFAGIAPADDDGEGAVGRAPMEVAKPAGYDEWLADMTATADLGEADLKKAWEQSAPAYRAYIVETSKPTWTALKAKAAKVAA